MAAGTPKPTSRVGSKLRQLAGAIGSNIETRSPLLGQIRDTVSGLTDKPIQGETRFGNAMGAVKNSVINNSVILRQFAMLANSFKSSKKDRTSGTETPEAQKSSSSNKNKENKEAKGPSIVEYLDNKENPYYVMMQGSNNHLEQVVKLLERQVELTMQTMNVNKEVAERSKSASDLNSVGRTDAARARAAGQPRDSLGRFVTASGAAGGSVIPPGLTSTVNDVDGMMSNIKKYGRTIAEGFAVAVAAAARYKKTIMESAGRLGGTIKAAVGKIKPLTQKFAGSLGPMVDSLSKTAQPLLGKAGTALQTFGKSKLGSIALRGLGMGARIAGSGPFLAITEALRPSELGDGTAEGAIKRNYAAELSEMGFDPETGKGKDPESTAKGLAFIESKLKSGQIYPDGKMPAEQQEIVDANNKNNLDMGYDPTTGSPLTKEATDRSMQLRKEQAAKDQQQLDALSDPRRTTQTPPNLTPDVFKTPPSPIITPSDNSNDIQKYLDGLYSPKTTPIVGSMLMSKSQHQLNILGNATAQRPTTTQQQTSPTIISNQGGPTNVHNGGNITNVIMGGSSIDLPQLIYNLPSSLM